MVNDSNECLNARTHVAVSSVDESVFLHAPSGLTYALDDAASPVLHAIALVPTLVTHVYAAIPLLLHA